MINWVQKFRLGIRWSLICLCLAAFSGCENPAKAPFGEPDGATRDWRERARAGHEQSLPRPLAELADFADATDAEGTESGEAEPPLPETPITELQLVEDVDLAVFLRMLARGAEVNLLLGENVGGPIRMSLPQDLSWDAVFRRVVEAHGLHYEWDGELLRVLGREDVERQIAMEETLRVREEAREQRRKAEPRQMELHRVRYADVTRLAASIRSALGGAEEEGGQRLSIIPDEDSGLLVVQAPPNRMKQVRRLVENLDQPAYQILIEATIVQTNSETARDLGVQWGYASRDVAGDGGSLDLGTSLNPDDWNMNFPAGFDAGDAGFSFGLIEAQGATKVLRAQLTALQDDGRLKIISSPSVTTLDKQTALIESGEERPFQSASGTGATTTQTVEFKEALLSLEVTPQVIDGEWIKLGIETSKDEFDDSKAVIIDGTLQVPVIKRSANTMLYLAHGQTTVIGGLSTQTENDSETGIPFLKDIPLFGGLFRNTVNRSAFSDTLIFITPYILPERVAEWVEPGEALEGNGGRR